MQTVSALWKKLSSINLVRVFVSTGLTTGIKILTAVILSKVIAIQLGPSGLAMIGQLSNFVNIALLLSTGGLANGVIKYVSSETTSENRKQFIHQSLKIVIICATIIGLVTLIGAWYFSYLCFSTTNYYYVFILLGFSMILFATHTYFVSLLNGLGEFKQLNIVNGISSIISLLISVLLIWLLSLKGALIAIAINQTISCAVSAFYTKKYLPDFVGFWKTSIERKWIDKLVSYSIMAFVTAIVVPISQILIRNIIIRAEGVNAAGLWEAINRISILYLTILINVMLVYYLPRISALNSKKDIHREVRNGFRFFVPIIGFLCLIIFLCRDIIIYMLLTPDFASLQHYFVPQLIGDAFKVFSYIFAYVVIAKKHTRFYIFSEVITTLLYVVFSYYLVGIIHVEGAVYAYMIVYILYFILQFIYYRSVVYNKLNL